MIALITLYCLSERRKPLGKGLKKGRERGKGERVGCCRNKRQQGMQVRAGEKRGGKVEERAKAGDR